MMAFIVDSTINWTSELSEGTPIPDYYWFRRDSEIAPTIINESCVCSCAIHCQMLGQVRECASGTCPENTRMVISMIWHLLYF